MSLLTLIKFFSDNGILIGIIALIFITLFYLMRTLLNEDKSNNFRSKFFRVLYEITKKREHEKKYISNDLNAKINIARRNMSFTNEYLPKSVRVDWIQEKDGTSYDINENEFVVCLDPANCQERNIVKLTTAVVERTTLTGIRHLFEKPLKRAIDLNVVKNILLEINNKKVNDWFYSNEYTPSIENNVNLKKWNNKIVEIDEKGLFTRILLVELTDFSKRIYSLSPRPFMIGEVEGLIDFLFKIASKGYHQDVPLEFVTAYIRVGVILVATTSKILYEGINPYLKCIVYNINKEIKTLYVIIWDKSELSSMNRHETQRFVNQTKMLEKEVLKMTKLKKDFTLKYKTIDPYGNRRNAKCLRYIVNETV